jgi:hypothetical protein
MDITTLYNGVSKMVVQFVDDSTTDDECDVHVVFYSIDNIIYNGIRSLKKFSLVVAAS